jgi:hypothetical protein
MGFRSWKGGEGRSSAAPWHERKFPLFRTGLDAIQKVYVRQKGQSSSRKLIKVKQLAIIRKGDNQK